MTYHMQMKMTDGGDWPMEPNPGVKVIIVIIYH
jgi:hypothetical protein